MNVGANALTQPATIRGSGGVFVVDPSDTGVTVSGQANPGAGVRLGELGADYFGLKLVAGDKTDGNGGFFVNGIWDATSPNAVVGFDYPNDAFPGGAGSIYFGNAAGTKIGRLYVGTGVPANAGGSNGDFALRTDTPGTVNQRIYVKSAGAWVGIL